MYYVYVYITTNVSVSVHELGTFLLVTKAYITMCMNFCVFAFEHKRAKAKQKFFIFLFSIIIKARQKLIFGLRNRYQKRLVSPLSLYFKLISYIYLYICSNKMGSTCRTNVHFCSP